MAKHLETRNQKNILYVFKQNKAHTHTHTHADAPLLLITSVCFLKKGHSFT